MFRYTYNTIKTNRYPKLGNRTIKENIPVGHQMGSLGGPDKGH